MKTRRGSFVGPITPDGQSNLIGCAKGRQERPADGLESDATGITRFSFPWAGGRRGGWTRSSASEQSRVPLPLFFVNPMNPADWTLLSVVTEGAALDIEPVDVWWHEWRCLDIGTLEAPHPSYPRRRHILRPSVIETGENAVQGVRRHDGQ